MANSFPIALENLVEQLHHLPGIGKKTAQRLAIFLLKDSEENAHKLSQAILRVKAEIKLCQVCFNITESEICEICSNERRDKSTICVVEDIVDSAAAMQVRLHLRREAMDGVVHAAVVGQEQISKRGGGRHGALLRPPVVGREHDDVHRGGDGRQQQLALLQEVLCHDLVVLGRVVRPQ